MLLAGTVLSLQLTAWFLQMIFQAKLLNLSLLQGVLREESFPLSKAVKNQDVMIKVGPALSSPSGASHASLGLVIAKGNLVNVVQPV